MGGGMCGRGHAWWGHAWQGGMHGRGACVAGEHVMHAGIHTHSPTMDRMTDTCKNITLPQTLFAGGNTLHVHVTPTCVQYLLLDYVSN